MFQDAGVLVGAAACAATLLVPGSGRRAAAMIVTLLVAGALLVGLEADALRDAVADRPLLAGAGAVAGVLGLAVLAALIARRPAVLPVAAAVALPFRVPVPVGDETANLLVPLYGVIAAGCLAFAFGALRARGSDSADDAPAGDRRVRRVLVAVAVVIVLYAVQSLYSTDADKAVQNLAFFYLPFGVLLRLLLEVDWTPRLLRTVGGVFAGLAVVFAAIGIVEYATGTLLIRNEKVLQANDLKPYFRVNSLFFDPNVYGRYLALVMVGLAAVLLAARRPGHVAAASAALVLLWVGLVLSLSQSSFAALLVGLALVAALRWRPRPVLVTAAAAAAAAVLVLVAAPGAVGLDTESERDLDRATSGRVGLLRGGAEMAGDRPVWGFGSGAFAERYRVREQVRSERATAASHTIPLTVTAEQGVIGLAAYLFLLWAAFALLLRRVRGPLAGTHPVARVALAAAFVGLVVHTLVYAAFLEDPLTWALLGAGGALAAATRPEAGADARAESPARPRVASTAR